MSPISKFGVYTCFEFESLPPGRYPPPLNLAGCFASPRNFFTAGCIQIFLSPLAIMFRTSNFILIYDVVCLLLGRWAFPIFTRRVSIFTRRGRVTYLRQVRGFRSRRICDLQINSAALHGRNGEFYRPIVPRPVNLSRNFARSGNFTWRISIYIFNLPLVLCFGRRILFYFKMSSSD